MRQTAQRVHFCGADRRLPFKASVCTNTKPRSEGGIFAMDGRPNAVLFISGEEETIGCVLRLVVVRGLWPLRVHRERLASILCLGRLFACLSADARKASAHARADENLKFRFSGKQRKVAKSHPSGKTRGKNRVASSRKVCAPREDAEPASVERFESCISLHPAKINGDGRLKRCLW